MNYAYLIPFQETRSVRNTENVISTSANFDESYKEVRASPSGSDGKESTRSEGDAGSVPGSGRSPGKGMATPVFLPGRYHGQRSLAGCSPWDCKELDITKGLTLSLHFHEEVKKN